MGENSTNTKDKPLRTSKARREKARERRALKILILVIIISVSFIAGFVTRSQVTLMSKIGIPVGDESSLNVSGTGLMGLSETYVSKSLKSTYNSLSERVAEIEEILESNSFDSVDVDASTKSVMEAVMKNTGDSYAKYYDAEEYAKLVSDSKRNSYDGIGVLFSEVDDKVSAADVFEGGEADMKGVKSGDYIKSINGQYSDDWAASEVMSSIMDSAGSSIMITWGRSQTSGDGSEESDYTVSLDVREMNQENVTSELKDDTVGYIKINQFTDSLPDLLKQRVEDLSGQGALSFVIDIRDNPGGYVSSALDCASLFVSSGTLINIETITDSTSKTRSGEVITDKKIVLIENSNTAAAAEVFASALKDNAVATVVGQASAGKGVVSATRELSFGGAIRYSAAQYTSANGNEIQGNGVKPDIAISNTEIAGVDDNQLTIACQTASSLASQ